MRRPGTIAERIEARRVHDARAHWEFRRAVARVEVIVEFFPGEHTRDRLVVHDVALLAPIRRQLRSRRVRIEHVSTW